MEQFWRKKAPYTLNRIQSVETGEKEGKFIRLRMK